MEVVFSSVVILTLVAAIGLMLKWQFRQAIADWMNGEGSSMAFGVGLALLAFAGAIGVALIAAVSYFD